MNHDLRHRNARLSRSVWRPASRLRVARLLCLLFSIILAPSLVDNHTASAGAKDITNRTRIKVVVGRWSTEFGAIELTEDVAITKDSPEMSLTFFRVKGLPAVYSVIDDTEGQAVLLLSFDGENEIRMLGLELRSRDLLVIKAGNDKTFEWHRLPDNLDLTDHATLKRLSGIWTIIEVSDQVEFTTEPEGEFRLPDSQYKAQLFKVRSSGLGDRMPIKSYAVLRVPGTDSVTLVLSWEKDDRRYFPFRLEGDVAFLDNRPFAMRGAPVVAPKRETAPKSGTLDIRVAYGEVLGLTAAEFTVRLEGDESTGFLKREEGSGSSFMQSGYAHFALLPQGKYRLTITGYFKKGDDRIPFSMGADYDFVGGTVVCEANVSNGLFHCIQ
jgi:hypothetical protein